MKNKDSSGGKASGKKKEKKVVLEDYRREKMGFLPR